MSLQHFINFTVAVSCLIIYFLSDRRGSKEKGTENHSSLNISVKAYEFTLRTVCKQPHHPLAFVLAVWGECGGGCGRVHVSGRAGGRLSTPLPTTTFERLATALLDPGSPDSHSRHRLCHRYARLVIAIFLASMAAVEQSVFLRHSRTPGMMMSRYDDL